MEVLTLLPVPTYVIDKHWRKLKHLRKANPERLYYLRPSFEVEMLSYMASDEHTTEEKHDYYVDWLKKYDNEMRVDK